MSAIPASLDLVHDAESAASLLNPLRREMLEALVESPDSAAGLARRMKLPRQKVNYHLRELEAEGLVDLQEERRKGNCTERIVRARASAYVISPEAIGGLGAEPERFRDRFSSAYLLATAARVLKDVGILRRRADSVKMALPTFTLETEVRFASAEALNAFTEGLANEAARLAAAHHDETAPEGRTFRFVIGSYPAITKSDEEAAREAREAGN